MSPFSTSTTLWSQQLCSASNWFSSSTRPGDPSLVISRRTQLWRTMRMKAKRRLDGLMFFKKLIQSIYVPTVNWSLLQALYIAMFATAVLIVLRPIACGLIAVLAVKTQICTYGMSSMCGLSRSLLDGPQWVQFRSFTVRRFYLKLVFMLQSVYSVMLNLCTTSVHFSICVFASFI